MLENFKSKVLEGINSKPKYMLPMVALVFIILLNGIALVIVKPKNNPNKIVANNLMNVELQDPNLDKSQTKNKFDALFAAYDKKTDFSAIQDLQGINAETKTLELDDKNLYSMSEMAIISKANGQSLTNKKEINTQSNYGLFKNSGASNPFALLEGNSKGLETASIYPNRNNNIGFNKSYSNYENYLSNLNNLNLTNSPNNTSTKSYANLNNAVNDQDVVPKKSSYDENMALFKAQMAVIDSMANKKKSRDKRPTDIEDEAKNTTDNELLKESKKIKTSAENQRSKNEDKILEVTKTEQDNSRYFNTVGLSKKNSFIKAILDEGLKVYDGSRVRIRLMDNIQFDGKTLDKGTYLYGIISGFSTQRVLLTITNIAFNNEILNIKLDVYDQDGMKGLYIPESLFREITKEASAKSIQNQNVQFSDNNTINATTMAYSAAQDIYKTSTRALSDAIRKRKAVLKYNTQIFLVNTKN